MKSITTELSQRVSAAIAAAFGPETADADPAVRQSQNPQFGDYQSNCAMALAKRVGEKPRDVATRIIEQLKIDDMCEQPEIAGPGFVNLRLKSGYMAGSLAAVPPTDGDEQYDRLGIDTAARPDVVAIDMSSPNLAKEMHVGHLRSTVIGDSVARILEFAGHKVERINHVGDWGTQFGMLVAHLHSERPEVLADPQHLKLGDLESFYREAKAHFDRDEQFADEARKTVVKLQQGDPQTVTIWHAFCDESLRHCHAIYDRLGIEGLIDRGESFYNDRLGDVVEELRKLGMVEKSEGADCIFLDGFRSREGEPLPMMVRKSDGGFNYATTDLAAVQHRVRDLSATRLIYVVGAPQKQHFDMLFAAARQAGWAPEGVRLEHLAFGSMLGADGKPFKTREGGTVKLKDLLDEAVSRARAIVEENIVDISKSRDMTVEEVNEIAETVGISAVKYFDLSHNLSTDYRFEWDHMLSMDGNTAPYMLYAYARIRSIGRKAGIDYADLPADAALMLEHPAELELAKGLLRFREVIDQIVADLQPNALTDYLFDLSRRFNRFYDRKLGVRVIDAESDGLRNSRLRLCDLAARTLKTGLQLLGISTLERM